MGDWLLFGCILETLCVGACIHLMLILFLGYVYTCSEIASSLLHTSGPHAVYTSHARSELRKMHAGAVRRASCACEVVLAQGFPWVGFPLYMQSEQG